MGLSKVALTVDLEEWTVPQDFTRKPARQLSETVKIEVARKGLNRLLKILHLEEVQATFFVTVYFAQRNRALVRQMLDAGHEIGNHGMDHNPKTRQTWNDWVETIRKSTRALEELLGTRPCGYREPYFAITKETINALMRNNYLYDSSVLGTWLLSRYRQGFTVPSNPFVWNSQIEDKEAKLVELPISVFPKLRIPAGWWWLRKNCGESIPWLTAKLLFKLTQPFIIEMHTWELTDVPEGYAVPFHVRHKCGRGSAHQIHSLIRRLRQTGGEFVLMTNLALETLKEGRQMLKQA